MDKVRILNAEVDYWKSTNKVLFHFFEQNEITGMLALANYCLVNHPQRDTLIPDFVAGLALLPISLKTNKHWDEFERLTNPVVDLVKDRIKSNDFIEQLINSEISGKGTLTIEGGASFPIDSDELILHLKRTNTVVVNRKSVVNLYQNWGKYMKENYGEHTTNIKQGNTQPGGIKITFRQIALKLVYNGEILQDPRSDPDKIADKLAEKYGHTSGWTLYSKHYIKLLKPNQRTGVHNKQLMIKDIECILPLLNDKGMALAETDLKKLNMN